MDFIFIILIILFFKWIASEGKSSAKQPQSTSQQVYSTSSDCIYNEDPEILRPDLENFNLSYLI
jgi:hypothetical protein